MRVVGVAAMAMYEYASGIPRRKVMRTWFGVLVIIIGALCYRSFNWSFFPLVIAVSFISSGALAITAFKTGDGRTKRYSLIVGIVVFILTALASGLKMSVTQ